MTAADREAAPPAVTRPRSSRTRGGRTAARAFRPRRIVPAVIAAVALMAVGLLALVEIVSGLLGRPARLIPYPAVLEWARTTRWNETEVLVGAGIVAALGLLLLLIALVPGHPSHVPLRSGDPDLTVGMRRRGFERALAHAASGVPGIRRARARVRGGLVRVRATTSMNDTTGLRDATRLAVIDAMESMGPVRPPDVRVDLRRR